MHVGQLWHPDTGISICIVNSLQKKVSIQNGLFEPHKTELFSICPGYRELPYLIQQQARKPTSDLAKVYHW